jgi:hypothetical protein
MIWKEENVLASSRVKYGYTVLSIDDYDMKRRESVSIGCSYAQLNSVQFSWVWFEKKRMF